MRDVQRIITPQVLEIRRKIACAIIVVQAGGILQPRLGHPLAPYYPYPWREARIRGWSGVRKVGNGTRVGNGDGDERYQVLR
jgi:hypothetical protein